MTERDDIILEYLEETDVALNKRGLEVNLQREGYKISYSTIKRRLPKLEENNLITIEDSSGPWYRISEKGKRYLNGELDLRNES